MMYHPQAVAGYLRFKIPEQATTYPFYQNGSFANPNRFPMSATPSEINANVNEIEEIPTTEDDSADFDVLDAAGTGKLSPGWTKAIIAGIVLLGVAIATTAIVAPILVANSQSTAQPDTDTSTSTTAPTTALTTVTTTTSSTSTSTSTTSTSTSSTTSTSTSTSSSTSATTSTTVTTTSTTTSSTTTTITTTISSCNGWTWNSTGVTVAGIVGSPGNAANQLARPWNLVIDSNNSLYIADADNSRVQKWYSGSTSGITVAGNGTNGSATSELAMPRSVYVSQNNIYVVDGNNNRILLFPNGSRTGQIVASQSLSNPFWVELDSNGYIYTADAGSNTIWKNQTSFASGNGLNGPQGLSVLSNGTIYISNTLSHTILQWNPGQSSGTIAGGVSGSSGSGSNQFTFPTSVVSDNYGNFWVVDNGNHRVQFYCRYSSNTTVGRTIAGGSYGTGPTNLNYPVGLDLDSSLNLYVTDTSNHRVQRFQRIT